MVKNKKCDCGHSKNEHMLTQKNTSVLDVILFHECCKSPRGCRRMYEISLSRIQIFK